MFAAINEELEFDFEYRIPAPRCGKPSALKRRKYANTGFLPSYSTDASGFEVDSRGYHLLRCRHLPYTSKTKIVDEIAVWFMQQTPPGVRPPAFAIGQEKAHPPHEFPRIAVVGALEPALLYRFKFDFAPSAECLRVAGMTRFSDEMQRAIQDGAPVFDWTKV